MILPGAVASYQAGAARASAFSMLSKSFFDTARLAGTNDALYTAHASTEKLARITRLRLTYI